MSRHPAAIDPTPDGQRLTRYLAELDDAQQDHLLAALTDERRRRVLRILLDGPASVEGLARRVVVSEAGPDEREPARDADRVDEVIVSLYHVHLPKLDAGGFVAFDPDAKWVQPGWALPAVAADLVSGRAAEATLA